MIQEPCTYFDASRRLTPTHTNYELFAPVATWDPPPRTITFVRRTTLGHITYLDPDVAPHPDLTAVKVSLRAGQELRLVNVYNAGAGSERAGEAVDLLLRTRRSHTEIIAGDFNLHHPLWSAPERSPPTSPQATRLVDYAEHHGLLFLGPYTEEGTHSRGNTLDLVWGSIDTLQLRPQCLLAHEVANGSDHTAVSLRLATVTTPVNKQKEKLRAAKIEPDTFLPALSPLLPNIPSNPSPSDLDTLAEGITGAIQQAYTAAYGATRHGPSQGTPWWNDQCRKAEQEFKKAKRRVRTLGPDPHLSGVCDQARQRFHRTITTTKQQFFQDKVEHVSSDKELFKMVGWSSSRSRIRNPFLLRPDGSKAATSADRAELLLDAHLPCNRANQDVPRTQTTSPAPSSAGCWPEITADEIEKAVLQTSTAPGLDRISTDVLKV